MSENTTETLFEMAIAAEKEAQVFYAGLIKKFQHVPKAVKVWREMMQDEVTHFQELQKIQATLTEEQLRAPVDQSIIWKAESVREFSAEDSLNRIETLEDAFQTAHDIEYSEVNTVFEFILTEFVDPDAQRGFVVSQLKEHVAKLDALDEIEWPGSVRAKEL